MLHLLEIQIHPVRNTVDTVECLADPKLTDRLFALSEEMDEPTEPTICQVRETPGGNRTLRLHRPFLMWLTDRYWGGGVPDEEVGVNLALSPAFLLLGEGY